MLAMALPVSSRSAPTISLLARQKPVSSIAVIVPEKARVNNETLIITVLFTKFSLKVGRLGCDTVSPRTKDRLHAPPQVGQGLFGSRSDWGNRSSVDKVLHTKEPQTVGRQASGP